MAVPKEVSAFDFDDTLFDQKAFLNAYPVAVVQEFGSQHGISVGAFRTQIRDHYVGTAGYDHIAHLKSYGVNLETDDAELQLLKQTLAINRTNTGRDNLLFSDAEAAIKRRLADPTRKLFIFTINLPSYFGFKRKLCGTSLDGIPTWITDRNKGEHLGELWAEHIIYDGVEYTSAEVVDNAPEQLEDVPNRSNIRRIQIVRPGEKYARTSNPDIKVIASFDELD